MRRNLNIKQRKWRSFIFATIFGVTAATAVITVKPLESYAYTETAGVLNDGPVQMRKTPVDGDKITSLAAGTAVRVIDEVDGSDGMKWYKVQISYNGMASTGYIRSDFITLSTEDTSSGSAITDSSAQGAAGVVTNTNGLRENRSKHGIFAGDHGKKRPDGECAGTDNDEWDNLV